MCVYVYTSISVVCVCVCVQTVCPAGPGGVGGASAVRCHRRPGGDSGRRRRGGCGAATQRRIRSDGKSIEVWMDR